MIESASPRVFNGPSSSPSPGSRRVALVVSRWNEQVTRRLLDGAVARFVAAGVPADQIDVAWVPGAFELPLVADRLAAAGQHAAVLCLGAIIRGETEHDRHIAQAVARGLEEAARRRGVPVLFGVLTCGSLAQALARAASDPADNKGAECATAALDMIDLMSRLPSAGTAES
jgi:6,7-dimethyl-8-ribityllumazine synthase